MFYLTLNIRCTFYGMVGNHILRFRSRVAVKLNILPYIRRYTSSNENFEYIIPQLHVSTELWLLISELGSTQYLKNQLIDFDKTLHMYWYTWQNLGWDCSISVSSHLLQSYSPLAASEINLILFPLSILRMNWWNLTVFCILVCIDVDKILIGIIILCKFLKSYGHRFMSEFCIYSICWEWISGIWESFAYALILPSSRLVLVCIN